MDCANPVCTLDASALVCGGTCAATHYCSNECHAAHWEEHRALTGCRVDGAVSRIKWFAILRSEGQRNKLMRKLRRGSGGYTAAQLEELLGVLEGYGYRRKRKYNAIRLTVREALGDAQREDEQGEE